MGEIGVKTVLANRSLVLNTAVFYGDYTDIQVSTFTSYDSDGDGEDDAFFGNFLNAGDATIKGLEVEYNWASQSGSGCRVPRLPRRKAGQFSRRERGRFRRHPGHHQLTRVDRAIRANVDFPLFGGLVTGSVGYAYRDDSVLTNEGGAHPFDPTQPLLPLVQPSFGLVDAWIAWLSATPSGALASAARTSPTRST